ncbi:DUF6259 domain-containing protein [Fontisphaera persica]|uniref:DUF6259 domain-containing protein n=1 Tax=Fontisphaera persica TaxID=2974023 RepID=UPI0024BFD40E|nr:DUF6259 domain-containing protein [Fontisphaera persica]WCJ60633.1 DUF6259 domain-containing protein [Fontisphaera persica]
MLDFSGPQTTPPPATGHIQTRWYSIVHDAAKMGGLPVSLTFTDSGWQVPGLHWNDRLHHQQFGGFAVRYDPHPQIQCLSTGPVCTVVRIRARYTSPNGRCPESKPEVVYDWFYFHHEPLVLVQGRGRQMSPQLWHEVHFLEMAFATNAFTHWAGGNPPREGTFTAADQSHSFSRWAEVRCEPHAVGLLAAGSVMVYDGRSYGPYVHAHADAAWQSWSSSSWERSAWLYLCNSNNLQESRQRLAESTPGRAGVHLGVEPLRQRMAEQSERLQKARGAQRARAGWQLACLRLLEQQGRYAEALAGSELELPQDWMVVPAGDLRLIFQRHTNGLALLTLADTATGALLVQPNSLPLFEITLRKGTQEIQLRPDAGWGQVTWETARTGNLHHIQWRQAGIPGLEKFVVHLRIRAQPTRHRLTLELEAAGQAEPWSLWTVRFPQLTVEGAGKGTQLLLPYGAGVLKELADPPFSPLHGDYPGGWVSMQMAACYDTQDGAGLYMGFHDPVGSTKRFHAEPRAGNAQAAALSWEIPVPNMGQPANRFQSPGPVVWQLFRGDWFDAALIYRQWVHQEARWFPPMGAEGRTDTPLWMRELCAWGMTGGPPDKCVPEMLAFRAALGLPVGFHWYNWHQIPFDNDYPHYFPAKDGFVAGVRQLQEAGVAVMPYINGRLWDTHDKGINDWQFSTVALPAAAKMQSGEPYLETYGSRETNGQPVRLAVMCPTTKLWQEKVGNLVQKLFGECGVQAVYIDQVAAAAPVLCFDPAHGHPLGGGGWWNELGYWPMLNHLHAAKLPHQILTTECNAEPFLRWFDGYLTWHWQYEGQVPLFPAVYGGAIQMFGRAYRGGPSKDLALRMKAAQQLCWGEQLGWLEPTLAREPQNFAFFTNAVWLRWHLRRYFYAGQMARPPQLVGDIPTVTADWQWSGVWPVSTPALMAGAWHLPAENKLVLLFANVSDSPVPATIQYDLRAAGLTGRRLFRRQWTAQGCTDFESATPTVKATEVFPPGQLWAWEFSINK